LSSRFIKIEMAIFYILYEEKYARES